MTKSKVYLVLDEVSEPKMRQRGIPVERQCRMVSVPEPL